MSKNRLSRSAEARSSMASHSEGEGVSGGTANQTDGADQGDQDAGRPKKPHEVGRSVARSPVESRQSMAEPERSRVAVTLSKLMQKRKIFPSNSYPCVFLCPAGTYLTGSNLAVTCCGNLVDRFCERRQRTELRTKALTIAKWFSLVLSMWPLPHNAGASGNFVSWDDFPVIGRAWLEAKSALQAVGAGSPIVGLAFYVRCRHRRLSCDPCC